jgi:NADP-dependent 3-hydroxy acid dehydrogenase YdfG
MADLQRWQGRVAVVTGASSGIGAGIAEGLVQSGMKVALAARRADKLAELTDRLDPDGTCTMAVGCDVTQEAEIDSLFRQVADKWGAVDMVVNNAGVGWTGALKDFDGERIRQTVETNVIGFALVLKAALRALDGREDTLIVNTSSIFAHYPQVPNWATYQATKAAVKAMTDTVRREAFDAGSRTRMAMVSPGIVATEFREKATSGGLEFETYFADFSPILPSDVADAVRYIMSTPPHLQVQDILLAPMGQGL